MDMRVKSRAVRWRPVVTIRRGRMGLIMGMQGKFFTRSISYHYNSCSGRSCREVGGLRAGLRNPGCICTAEYKLNHRQSTSLCGRKTLLRSHFIPDPLSIDLYSVVISGLQRTMHPVIFPFLIHYKGYYKTKRFRRRFYRSAREDIPR